MKRLMLIFSLFLFVTYSGAVAAKHFWRGKTLSQSETEKRWGNSTFEATKFKTGDEKVRSSMAYVILKQQNKFVGKEVAEIRAELGPPDGFYFSDLFPAYIIQSAKTRGEEAWQIVFLLNREKRVSEIVVHKNCCD